MPALFWTHSFELHTWAPAAQARLAKVAFAPPAAQPCITGLKLCPTVTPLAQNDTGKFAATLCGCAIVTVQVPVPLQAGTPPDHPTNSEPVDAAAVRITEEPLA
jgi:hypothetical protein